MKEQRLYNPERIPSPAFPLPETYLQVLAEQGPSHVAAYRNVLHVAERIRAVQGRALLVGGAVRDIMLGRIAKDYDLEVYGLEAEQLEILAHPIGKVSEVGRAFGILKLTTESGIDIDLSLPRADSKIGEGHRGFAVKTNPHMSIAEAARRRDFTFNSMAADPLTGELFDPYGGYRDLQAGILRVTDPERFQDDPLRILRAIQFVGRYQFTLEPKSAELMRAMLPRLRELPRERLLEEWKKLLLKSPQPSLGLQAAMDLGIFHMHHPEFTLLSATPQDPQWHPEGDVWTHTKMAVDQAATIVRRHDPDEKQALMLMLASLCHDLGKPEKTVFAHGRYTAYGHDTAGVAPTGNFLQTLGVDTATYEKVTRLVGSHMWPHNNYRTVLQDQRVGDGAFRKLARDLSPATIEDLALLAQADHCGRGNFIDPHNPSHLLLPESFDEGNWLRSRAKELDVVHTKPLNVISGKDLIALGFQPGKLFGDIITLANQLHDDYDVPREDILTILQEGPHENAVERIARYAVH